MLFWILLGGLSIIGLLILAKLRHPKSMIISGIFLLISGFGTLNQLHQQEQNAKHVQKEAEKVGKKLNREKEIYGKQLNKKVAKPMKKEINQTQAQMDKLKNTNWEQRINNTFTNVWNFK